MADSNVKYTPYEIGGKIKSLLDEGTDTKVILESIGIKRAQLITYKKNINNGRLEDLRTNSVRKILAEVKKSEQSENLRKPKQSENLGGQGLGNKMINAIEKERRRILI